MCFRVLVKNENRGGNTQVSYAAKVYVEYDGHVVELFKDGKVIVSPRFISTLFVFVILFLICHNYVMFAFVTSASY